MEKKLQELKDRLIEIDNLNSATAVLSWDQSTYMPPGGAARVPAAFVAEFTGHSAESYQVWAEARPKNDFKAVEPYLVKTVDYCRKFANYFPGYEHIADPLIDMADYGMKVSTLQALFAEL